MSSDGQEIEKLQNALMDAFPNKTSLKQMLRLQLGQNLEEIVSEGNLRDIVFTLIVTAVAEGWDKKLISAALEKNPGNLKLQNIAKKLNRENERDEEPNKALPLKPECSAYDEKTWVGRKELLEELSQKLQKQCRILIITGITGLGKTALAERLTCVELSSIYPNHKQINLDDRLPQDFASVAEDLLQQLGVRLTVSEPKNPDGLLNMLVQKLQNNRYLVQINSLETLLKSQNDDDCARNKFKDDKWKEFFYRLLAGQNCQSRLILTSQALPTEFGSEYQRYWHQEPLNGLKKTEQFELFQKLFYSKNIEINPTSELAVLLRRIGEAYEGHPLVIEVITGEILASPFKGNVEAYWQKYRQEFEARKSVIGHQHLQLLVKDRVEKSLKSVERDVINAYLLLCRCSVYRCPVPEKFWFAMLGNLTVEEKKAALLTLKCRYLLVEEGFTNTYEDILRQHNLIRNVTYRLLKKLNSQWKDSHYIAANMWLTSYKVESDLPNLEKVRGYLEAFYHFCEVEDWEKAYSILFTSLGENDEQLCRQLEIWGYYREQIKLCNQLVYKLNDEQNMICLRSLGNAYDALGKYDEAIQFHQKSLTIARSIEDRDAEGKALGNLGTAYYGLGDYQRAIEYHYRSLEKVCDENGKGKAFGNLGITYTEMRKYSEAIEWQQKSLDIARSIQDRYGEGIALGNLGLAYYGLKKYKKAIDFHKESLKIAQEISDRNGEGIAALHLGETLLKIEQYRESLENLREALNILIEVGDRADEAEALRYLAEVYQKLGNNNSAIENCEQAIAIAKELHLPPPLLEDCQNLKSQLSL